ncbi:MAG: hypothetical protein GXY82_03350 [Methanospirillum sp.]|nr:hypothetical protein [Methanospirillum sp.]
MVITSRETDGNSSGSLRSGAVPENKNLGPKHKERRGGWAVNERDRAWLVAQLRRGV